MLALPVWADDGNVGRLPQSGQRLNQYSLSVGGLEMLQEYMSPYKYSGALLNLTGQRQHLLKHSPDWMYSSYMGLSFSPARNRTGNGHTTYLMFNGHFSWERIWIDNPSFTLSAGPELFAKLGGVINTRNSNNPAQPTIYLAGSIAGKATYRFRIKDFPMALSWDADIPLLGYNFAPTYGLQYYEIQYLDKFGEASHLAWPGNPLTLSQRVSLSIPVGSVQLKIGYAGDYFKYDTGGLKCKMYESSLMVGFVKRIEIKHNGR